MKFVWTTLQVKDVDASVAFYQDVVGLSVSHRIGAKGAHEIAFMTDGGKVLVELCEAQGLPEGVPMGVGVSIGFETEDAQAKWDELKAAGYEVSPMISPAPTIKFFFVKDPDGYSVQIAQQM